MDRLEREFTIEDLEEWTEYEVRVQAINGIGSGPWSQPVHGRTRESGEDGNMCIHMLNTRLILQVCLKCAKLRPLPLTVVPSSGPTNVSAFATTSSSILVRWGEVPETDRNGLILGYKVSSQQSPPSFYHSSENYLYFIQTSHLTV